MSAFRDLHRAGFFVMPNAWDIGSAVALRSLGFPAIATTSSGHAASLGRMDQQVTLDELLDHAMDVVAAVDLPLSVDAEYCFAEDASEIGAVVRQLASTGAAGLSIEDYNPFTQTIDPVEFAAERVAAAAAAARETDLVLTARAENLLYHTGDFEDTVTRLVAYRDAGADVVYAPGLVDLKLIAALVREVDVPVNVLILPGAPSLPELAAAGVRRVSTGGALARAAYGELRRLGLELRAAADAASTSVIAET